MSIKKQIASILFTVLYILIIPVLYADQDLISSFPLAHYDQNPDHWIKSADPDYNTLLLSKDVQRKHLNLFYDHTFGSLSPWDANHVKIFLNQSPPNDIKTIEESIIVSFDNNGKPDTKINYGENFEPYAKDWIATIATQINTVQLSSLFYQADHRAIAIDNLHARVLPTDEVSFYSYKLAGQGYPFDNLQISNLWAGTPVYIIAETLDHAWSFVLTPDYIAWVKSNGIARVDDAFINAWKNAANNKLMAITQTKTSVVDANGTFLFSTYVGAVFPAGQSASEIMVPVANANHHATIVYAAISPDSISAMPLEATPHHFADIMRTLVSRPYGWGGMYFYSDCSAELKSLFTPFAVWLPRHSSDQVTVGKMVDMTIAAPDKRLSYLIENGHKLITIIYIGGHIVLYTGNYPNLYANGNPMAMTYQNLWGLSPNPPIRRAVIGKAVLLPMLLQYPEDTSLVSLANKSYFQVSYLDEIPTAAYTQDSVINLRMWMTAGE